MSRSEPVQAREGEEIWETTTAGTVWVTMTDDRGRVRDQSFGGKAGTRMRIKTSDRIINEDAVVMGDHVFMNGLLVRVDVPRPTLTARSAVPAEAGLTDAELTVAFSKTGAAFAAWVDGLNELNTRRMYAMAVEVDATQSQLAYLRKAIKERYVKEGDSPSYRDLKATPSGVSVS